MIKPLNAFIKEIYDFLKTVTIYNPDIAVYYKKNIEYILGRDIKDKDNKYFINLQGNYFKLYNILTDEEKDIQVLADYTELDDPDIIVPVIDSLSQEQRTDILNNNPEWKYNPTSHTILLCKEVLADIRFKETNNLYKNNTLEFNKLLSDNKEYSSLIRNILFPIEILDIPYSSDSDSEYVIALESSSLMFDDSPDVIDTEGNIIRSTNRNILHLVPFSMLKYYPDILEPSEIISIEDAINTFLNLFKTRWYIKEYVEFEKYSYLVYWTILWSVLPMVVFKQRLENMHTNAVHTDLLWEYLKSKGFSDYRDILTRDQQIFLYKNIRYLLKIKGTRKALRILADKLLSPFNISLVTKVIALDNTSVDTICTATPSILSRNILNNDIILNDSIIQETFDHVYNKEERDKLEPKNGPDLRDSQFNKIKRAPVSLLPTKLVEFNTENVNYEIGLEYIKYAMESYVYLLHKGKINNTITIFENVITNGIIVDSHTSLAILIFLLFSQNGPKVVVKLSGEGANRNTLLNRYILYNKDTVLLDENNISDYSDKLVKVLGPKNIPNIFNLTRPYNIEKTSIDSTLKLPLSSEEISDGMVREEDIYDILDISPKFTNLRIDIDDILNLQDTIPDGVFSDKDTLLEYMDRTFTYKSNHYGLVRLIGDMRFNLAFDHLYEQILVIETLDIELENNIGHTSYSSLFSSISGFKSVLTYLNTSTNIELEYDNAIRDILEKMLPVLSSKFVNFGELDSSDFKLMRKLFIEMCTYDLAFFNISENLKDYDVLSTIVYDDTLPDMLHEGHIYNTGFIAPFIEPVETIDESAIAPDPFVIEEEMLFFTPEPIMVSMQELETQKEIISPISGKLLYRYGDPLELNIGISSGSFV